MVASLEQRFASFVAVGEGDACHLWTGGFGSTGTPNMWVSKKTNPKTISARRYAWEAAHGPLPATRWVTMACKNKSCVRVDHMMLRAANDDVTRFWSKVDKSAGPRACWPWEGRRNDRNYGVFSVGHHGNKQAHRYAYELANGPIGDPDLFVCHHCDYPPCCNPDHFFLGTAQDNTDDMWRKGRGSCGPAHSAIMASRPNVRRVTAEQAADVFRLRAEGLTQAKIAAAVGISPTTVWNVLQRSSEHKSEEQKEKTT